MSDADGTPVLTCLCSAVRDVSRKSKAVGESLAVSEAFAALTIFLRASGSIHKP